ncbi:gamma carbonic anhydrase family protein [Leucobacter chromiireducens]|uniref:gamma carbonic anhydrase family protein n=1 Tax=Leucobacter chromiireducens TaxID=283877 RepID=UPI000F640983|nr:gamma carbonic anhydrase family protein [Leucobacter chromiireducens]
MSESHTTQPAASAGADPQSRLHGLVIPLDPVRTPRLAGGVWLAPGAVVVGDVVLAEEVSVWYNAVVRGDSDVVRIGPRTNLQDGVVVHTQKGDPAVIGADVSVGHNATIHGATIEAGCLVGMGATVLSGATVGAGALIAAGALVPQGVSVPAHSLFAGVPGRVIRELRPEERAGVRDNAANYLQYTEHHAEATREHRRENRDGGD